jgi:transposase
MRKIVLPALSKLPDNIEACHALIRELASTIESLCKQIEKQTAEIQKQADEIAWLKEQLTLNSNNSSQPPSQDLKSKKKKKHQRPPSGRPSGGQVGHPGHFRKMLESSEVDAIVTCKISHECLCGGKIEETGEYRRHQVFELPEIEMNVTEYQLMKGICNCCQKRHVARLPEGVTWGFTGPRLTSFMTDMVTSYNLSRRELQDFLKNHFHFDLSLGVVFKKQRIVNEILKAPVEEIKEEVHTSSFVNMDETGHSRDGEREWVWAALTAHVAYFLILASRGKKALNKFMGSFKGIVISDRYSAYNIFGSSRRQLCWAHLKRDFTRISEKSDGVAARIGHELLYEEAELFKLWGLFKRGEITRKELQRKYLPIRKRLGECLERGSYTAPQLRVAKFCQNLLKDFDALWTFIEVENLEPTNNHAERGLRHLVIWRKKYFATRSDYGTEYVARTASFRKTCKLQSKNPFELLCQVTKNYFSKKATVNLFREPVLA